MFIVNAAKTTQGMHRKKNVARSENEAWFTPGA